MITTVSFKNFVRFAFIFSFLGLPITGCGSATAPVGVEDNSLEEAESFEETEEYVSGEEGI